jgi:hypothetical protein
MGNEMGKNSDSAIVDRVEELCRNCNLGKYRHFNAAHRAKRLSDYLGVPVVAINILLGSVFFIALSQELPTFAKWGGGFLGLSAALISGITTFFNFGKLFEGHRNVANKYVAVAGRCETAIARFRDGLLDLKGLDLLLNELQERYAEINDEAKAFTTNQADFQYALHSESLRTSTMRVRQETKSS